VEESRQRILLVDDQADVVDLMSRVLSRQGYFCDVAPNGDVALGKLATADYTLIISNLRMPVMDGEALYQQVCLLYPALRRRVIFCTGDAASPDAARFLAEARVPVLLKPFELATLMEAVQSAIGRGVLVRRPEETPTRRQDTLAIPA